MTTQNALFEVHGIPADADEKHASRLRARMIIAATAFASDYGSSDFEVAVGSAGSRGTAPDGIGEQVKSGSDALSIDDRASYYQPAEPAYTLDQLVLPQETMADLSRAVAIVEQRQVIFDRWGLRRIEPFPSSAINLHGAPGTGKTLAAHAIAHKLGRRIICAKYSQLESKYHGEGPKNLDALFHAASRHNAVVFLDESDSLMSRRFEVTSHGSEMAINAMRSELLMSLDRFEGLVLFATNFVQSYDPAFHSRVRHVLFPEPDRAARAAIWAAHLPVELPLADGVSVEALAEVDGICGREIKTAVIEAASEAALSGRTPITQEDLLASARRVRESRLSVTTRLPSLIPTRPDADEAAAMTAAVRRQLAAGDVEAPDA